MFLLIKWCRACKSANYGQPFSKELLESSKVSRIAKFKKEYYIEIIWFTRNDQSLLIILAEY